MTAGEIGLRRFDIPVLLWLPARIFLGLTKPTRVKILGQELAGEIEDVGKDVKRFSIGDPVVAGTGFSLGAYAEYKCLPERGVIALKPANISYEEAAAVPMSGLEAMQLIGKANIQPGQNVLIVGAGGSIGTFAVQLAKHFGAEVTAVDSTGKLEMLRSIGADRVIDYTREDFTRSRQTYDRVIDVAGKSSRSRSERVLKPDGAYVSYSSGPAQTGRSMGALVTNRKETMAAYSVRRVNDLARLIGLIEAGKVATVIGRTFPLEQVAEAHRYAESGRKQGNVIITVG